MKAIQDNPRRFLRFFNKNLIFLNLFLNQVGNGDKALLPCFHDNHVSPVILLVEQGNEVGSEDGDFVVDLEILTTFLTK